VSFHEDYLSPRIDNVLSINVVKNGKYMFPTSPIPLDVCIEGEMLDKVVDLKFMDHDINDEHKLLELDKKNYLRTKSALET
jgi:hypothetical protein